MGRDSFRRIFRGLKKSEKYEPEKEKAPHHWHIRRRKSEFAERKHQLSVTKNKVDPWFENIRHPHGETVLVLYDFNGTEADELRCKFGDRLIVHCNRDETWWNAKLERTGQVGYVPANYLTEEEGVSDVLDAWHDIDRREAERKLLMPGLDIGSYIFRPSSNPCKIILTVLCDIRGAPSIKHYRIEEDFTTAEFFITPSDKFKSLKDLVEFYKQKNNTSGLFMKKPWPRPSPPPIQSRNLEIPRDHLEIGRKIGRGEFGNVYMAEYRGSSVVVKAASGSKSRDLLLSVAPPLQKLNHLGLVRLLGVCSLPINEPVLFVLDFLARGCLKDYLRSSEGKETTFIKLISIMSQITEGMDYLENAGSYHGDLRAANVFLTEDLSAKIGNFGLNRILNDTDSHRKRRNYTLRWTAPEVIQPDYVDSIKSDIWSFGVLFFEVLTYGSEPYADVEPDDINTKIASGYRLPNPSDLGFTCDEIIYVTMKNCWSIVPNARPSFRDTWFFLEDYLNSEDSIYTVLQ